MSFPKTRLRRLRYNPILRDLVKETKISLDDLIYPMFVCTGKILEMKFLRCLANINYQLIILLQNVKLS